MRLSFRLPKSATVNPGVLVELTTNHPEAVSGVPALFLDGELVRTFVTFTPGDDSPPLDSEWTEEDGPKMPPMIRKQFKLFKSRKRRAVKQEVLRRDGYRCRFCGMDLLNDDHGCLSQSVDHLVPHERRTEPTRRRDLLACCSVCNSIKGNKHFSSFEGARAYVLQERAERLRAAREAAGVTIRPSQRWASLRRPWAVLTPVLAWAVALWPWHSAGG